MKKFWFKLWHTLPHPVRWLTVAVGSQHNPRIDLAHVQTRSCGNRELTQF